MIGYEWLDRCISEHGLQNCTLHVAIMVEPYLSHIWAGRKTIESRFSKKRIAPYGKIHSGDVIFLKKSGGPVVGFFRAGNVLSFEIHSAEDLASIRKEFGEPLCVEPDFWAAKADSAYATLIPIRDLHLFPSPIEIHAPNRQSWIILPQE